MNFECSRNCENFFPSWIFQLLRQLEQKTPKKVLYHVNRVTSCGGFVIRSTLRFFNMLSGWNLSRKLEFSIQKFLIFLTFYESEIKLKHNVCADRQQHENNVKIFWFQIKNSLKKISAKRKFMNRKNLG